MSDNLTTNAEKPQGRSVSITFTPELMLAVVGAGPYALVGVVTLYYMVSGKDIPENTASIIRSHGAWIIVLLVLLWLVTWLVRHFRDREQELVSSLKDLTERYERSSLENTKVLAGVYELVRVIHSERNGNGLHEAARATDYDRHTGASKGGTDA